MWEWVPFTRKRILNYVERTERKILVWKFEHKCWIGQFSETEKTLNSCMTCTKMLRQISRRATILKCCKNILSQSIFCWKMKSRIERIVLNLILTAWKKVIWKKIVHILKETQNEILWRKPSGWTKNELNSFCVHFNLMVPNSKLLQSIKNCQVALFNQITFCCRF